MPSLIHTYLFIFLGSLLVGGTLFSIWKYRGPAVSDAVPASNDPKEYIDTLVTLHEICRTAIRDELMINPGIRKKCTPLSCYEVVVSENVSYDSYENRFYELANETRELARWILRNLHYFKEDGKLGANRERTSEACNQVLGVVITTQNEYSKLMMGQN